MARLSHLGYAGDADIGENTNIGCGNITANSRQRQQAPHHHWNEYARARATVFGSVEVGVAPTLPQEPSCAERATGALSMNAMDQRIIEGGFSIAAMAPQRLKPRKGPRQFMIYNILLDSCRTVYSENIKTRRTF